MKRTLILPILLCFLSLSFTPEGTDPLWLQGTWKGTGFQLNTRSIWPIVFEANPVSGTYTIQYPSLNCGGHWELVRADSHRAEFRERITEGFLNCVNNGTLIITKVTPNHISYTFFSPYDESLEAHSTLQRVGEPNL